MTAADADVPIELLRLTRFERGLGVKRFRQWQGHLNARHPEAATDNRQKALNLAYIGVAQMWLALGGPVLFIAAGLESIRSNGRETVLIVLCLVWVLITGALLAVRWRQARSFWPTKVYPNA